MSKYHLANVFIGSIIALAFTACTPTSAPTTSTADTTTRAPLWKVTSAHRTMYITGSAGASLKKYPIPAVITNAFSESGELIMEGKTSMDKMEQATLMKKYAYQPYGKQLNDDLDASQLKLVKNAFSSLSVAPTLENLQPYQPWFAVMVLHSALLKASSPHYKPHAFFVYFHNKANDRDMPVTFLNTNAGELKIYANMPQAAWLAMMAKTVLEPEQLRKIDHARMVRAWENGDAELVGELYTKSYQDYPKVYDSLVTSYEPRWLKSLEAVLNENGKSVFVIVNAANLVGPINILNSLKKAGYHVEQL